jgi:hypothetical protein
MRSLSHLKRAPWIVTLVLRDDCGPNCEIGNEVAIHNIHVENGRSAVDGGLRFGAEPSEISRENGGGEFNHRNV